LVFTLQKRSTNLAELDDELVQAIPRQDLALAAQVTFELRDVAAGDAVTVREHERALLLVSGVLWSEFRVGPGCTPQLLVPGALVLTSESSSEFMPAQQRIAALVPSALAVLDQRVMPALVRWPLLADVLRTKLADQHQDLAVQAAIVQLPRVEDRIVAFLWRMAERCGKVGPTGVRVPLQLTHERLGQCVGAQRSTVSLALTTLRDRGVLMRDGDGSWILSGAPPEFVADDGASDGLPQWVRRRDLDGNA
jgi:hypothetical protein